MLTSHKSAFFPLKNKFSLRKATCVYFHIGNQLGICNLHLSGPPAPHVLTELNAVLPYTSIVPSTI